MSHTKSLRIKCKCYWIKHRKHQLNLSCHMFFHFLSTLNSICAILEISEYESVVCGSYSIKRNHFGHVHRSFIVDALHLRLCCTQISITLTRSTVIYCLDYGPRIIIYYVCSSCYDSDGKGKPMFIQSQSTHACKRHPVYWFRLSRFCFFSFK